MFNGPTVPRRQLGRLLNEAREGAGLTIQAACRTLEWSAAKMYRVEAGAAPLRTHDITAMCKLYEIAPEMTDLLVALARQGTEGAWWHTYGKAIPSWFELYVGMEANAMKLRQYDAALIPGLLQTPEYAEHVLRKNHVSTDEEIAAKISLREERKRIFARRRPAPPKTEWVIDESALRRPLPRADDWRAQLAYLVEMASRPMISLRIMPMSAGPNSTLITGSFVILDFYPVGMRTPDPPTVYCEGISGALYLDDPEVVDNYQRRWTVLGRDALSCEGSVDFLATLIKEYS